MQLTLPQPKRASIEFNNSFSKNVLGQTRERYVAAYNEAAERFRQQHGRLPETLDEVEGVLAELPAYQADRVLRQIFTGRMWESLTDALRVNHDAIDRELRAVPLRGTGELRLNPDVAIPDYYARSQFHLAPGNYQSTYIYPFLNELGPLSLTVTKRSWPEVKRTFDAMVPKRDYGRIVDFGSGLGRTTIALKELFPDAEVIGIDLAEPELRYAHREAEKLGLPILFLQEDIAHTSLESDSVDLVMAYIMHHEFPAEAFRELLREAHRILKPGGLFMSGDVTPNRHMLPLTRYLLGLQVETGAEPFWMEAGDMHLPEEMRAIGFTGIREEAPPNHPHGLHFPWWTIGTKAGS